LKQVKAYVVSNKRILPGGPHRAGRALASNLMRLHCPEIAREAKPGQFIMVRCGEECLLPRPFSIHQAKKDDIALFFAVLEGGKGTNWLAGCKEGDAIELPVARPLGNGFSIRPGSKNLLLVAGGIGIAPLYFLAEEALTRACSVTLVYGSHDKNRYPRRLLPRGVRLVTASEDGTVGYRGLATDLIPAYADWADQVFACGPVPMYKTMARMTELKGKPVQVSLEVVMGCGHGVCYGCTIRTKKGLKQVCKDGPVFDLDDIIWEELDFWR
jgi:dihydroorotate dehydrogenase electron transfer subunit